MARTRKPNVSESTKRRRPALTPEARQNQLIALATDLVEKRLIEGTASSQETTHFLKLAGRKSRLEIERQELENELIKARTEALQSSKRIEELYANAINAMRKYNGQDDSDDDY